MKNKKYHTLLINYCYIYINTVKTAFVIQIVQLGKYGTKSSNTDYFSHIGRLWSSQYWCSGFSL